MNKIRLYIAVLLLFIMAGCKKDEFENGNGIIAWGDSLTKGINKNESYPANLQRLSSTAVLNKGVGGASSTSILANMNANKRYLKSPAIIWAGRNNYKHPDQVKEDIAAMISLLGHQHYLILSIINKDIDGERKGEQYYDVINQLNNYLKETYGDHYVDVRSYLVASYDSNNAADKTNFDDDVPPASLRIDALHLSAVGYALVAKKVYENLNLLTK